MSRRIRGQPKVLVVDDEPDLLELLELTLSRMGLDTTRAESVNDALRLLDREPFDLCLTDMRLPDGEGLRVVEYIASNWASEIFSRGLSLWTKNATASVNPMLR